MEGSDNRDKLATPPTDAAVLDAHKAKRRAQRDKASLSALVSQLEKQAAHQEALFEALLGSVERLTQPIAPLTAGRASGKLPRATQIALLSDTHPGERVRPEEVGGVNEYTPEIFHERMDEFFRNLVRVYKLNQGGWDITQLLVWLGGDLMTGWIHEEYIAENYLSPTEEMYESLEAIVRGLRYLLAETNVERILVPTSCGNHGRNTVKMWSAGAFRTSYEFTLYRLLAREFADEKRITFQLGVGYENRVELYPGWWLGFQHGHEIKYQGGVSGIATSLNRRIQRVNSGSLAVQHTCFGHHHALGFHPEATGNGSLIGATAFGIGKGFRPEPPRMASLVVDEKHLTPCAMNPIFCQERRRVVRKSAP